MKMLKLVAAGSCLSWVALMAGPALASGNGLVISQVYGGGGNSGATYKNDFIEVFNGGASAVSLSGYSVQYAAATGSSWQATNLTGVTLAPGQYYLVQEAVGAGGTTNLPTPDATGTLAMSATAGKVALVSSTTLLTGSAPTGGTVVDLVGFGTTANGFEGGGPTPAPSNTTAVLRAANGCTDTNNNAADFTAVAPNPRNSATVANACSAGTTPSISLSVTPTSFAENGGSATVTATLSAASASTVTVNLAFGGSATNGTDYSASATTITIAAGSTSGSITLTAIDDATYEGDETVITSISGTPTGATAGAPNSATATITDDDPAPPPVIGPHIYSIQGATHVSPMNGQSVSNVPGIVTALASNGFYMQDGDGDGDPKTSDGILVFTSTAPTVTVGQEVLVSGTVTEFRVSNLATNLTITQIASPTVSVSSTNLFTNNTIVPVVIGSGGRQPPTEVIDNISTGNVESRTTFDSANEGIDFYESLEGMLVRINNPVATDRTASGTGTATIWVVGDAGQYATGVNARGGVTLRELNPSTPGGPVDYNPEHIQIFTGLPNTNPGVSFSLNVGDQLASFNGVVSYFGGNYEILPTTKPALVTPTGTTRGVSTLAVGANILTVGGYNVENLTVGDAQTKFNGLAADIVTSMGAPDIVSISEVQDNSGAANDGTVACDQTMAKLLSAINTAAGSSYNYDYRQINPVDGQDGGAPTGNIRVVQIFNTKRVTFDDKAAPPGTNLSTTPVAVTTDSNGKPTVSFSPGRIDPQNAAWSGSGGNGTYSASRKPLVGEYTFNGRRVFVISNHFTSRLGDDPLFGVDQPPVLLSEPQRRDQALLVHNFVKSILAIDNTSKVVVLGDFNEYDFGNPLRILRDGPLTSNGGEGGEPVLKNLSTELVTSPVERYSYVFNGNSQELDHIFVTPRLLNSGAKYQAVHLNAGYATQNSDHDPIVSSYTIAPNVPPTANAGGNQTVSPGASVTLSGSGTDTDGTVVSYAWTQTAGATVTLSGANTATASFTAPATTNTSYTFQLTVTDNDGATGTSTAIITVPADRTPDAFSFTAVTGADPGSVQTSNPQMITGIDSGTTISVSTGGQYSVDGGTFTSTAGTINSGQKVQVQLTASSSYSTTSTATLTIGTGTASYSVTTRAASTTPTPFSFSSKSNVPVSSVQTSDSIVVTGIEAPTAISVSSGGLFSINGGSFTSMVGAVVNNGDTVRVQQTASPTNSTTTTITLTIGGVDGSFSVTTVANSAPTANAGSNQTLRSSPNLVVTLDGTASSDPDGTIASYAWARIDGGTQSVSLSGANTAKPTFKAPKGSYTLKFQLVVTDNLGAKSAPSTVTVTLTP